jgi:hypothetical protein
MNLFNVKVSDNPVFISLSAWLLLHPVFTLAGGKVYLPVKYNTQGIKLL